MEFYHKCWAYSWEHLADTELGGWYGVLDRHNQQVSNPDCPPLPPARASPFSLASQVALGWRGADGAGDVKAWFSDYHSMGGIYECMRSL